MLQWVLLRIENDQMQVMRVAGDAPFQTTNSVTGFSGSLLEQIALGQSPTYMPDIDPGSAVAALPFIVKHNIQGYISAPLLSSGYDLLGFVIGYHNEPLALDEHNLSLINVGARVTAKFLQNELKAVENARELDRAEAQALCDELTEVYNRLGWERFVTSEEIRGQRYAKTLGIVMLDTNNLKVINDMYGHAAGDQMLQTVADTVKTTVRPQDVVARIGGDEFAILVIDTSEDALSLLVDRLLHAIEQTGYSVAIGSCMHHADVPMEETLHIADQRMYAHKRQQKSEISTGMLPR